MGPFKSIGNPIAGIIRAISEPVIVSRHLIAYTDIEQDIKSIFTYNHILYLKGGIHICRIFLKP
ncbi:hypothetical protein CBFG_00177 [Clostridiales bacterium 1_7_47FAA]|nr:hypothetical protein CBFG_00177 [Clostridiales bacterium 1_7_47FAA]